MLRGWSALLGGGEGLNLRIFKAIISILYPSPRDSGQGLGSGLERRLFCQIKVV